MIEGFLPLSVASAEYTGQQIMEKQKELHKARTEYGEEVMLLVDVSSDAKEKRDVKRYAKDMGNDLNRYLLVFLTPADIKGTALLTHENENEDDQWLYLPALKKMQRIASGSKKSYFMGTDFTYEDMESEDIENYDYTILREEMVDHLETARNCYVIEAVPANKEKKRASSYSRRIIWVDMQNFTTVKVEFYDRRNRLLKTQKSFEFEQISGTIYRPRKTIMDNHEKNHKTLTLVKKRVLNDPIEDLVFSERFILSDRHIE
ncbi:MAG: outer membrane lipoprotein-sorting protein [Desulfotignum sp.]|nr:outer membrane lipoprotein-sorting protein [Desulfotignum sp.]MCF8113394.1 outer membrane lipoprotein-sorting protein [Desulfotignum sp.]MCF8125124.1 outer membrane lipoprotein-sorting protein [Desulfotignum sp.]